jgi:uncharacterized membrane protein YfcA
VRVFPFDQPVAAMAGFAAIAVCYVVFGITGFGASLMTVPILSHFYPVPFVLALACILDLSSSVLRGWRRRHQADKSELVRVLPFSLLGAVAGVTLLVNLPRTVIVIAIGLFIVIYGLYGLIAPEQKRPVSRYWAPLAGFMGGTTGTMFGMGGPPVAIYITRRIMDKERLLATLSVGVGFNLLIRFGVFAVAGVFMQKELVPGLLLFAPAAFLGVRFGSRLHLSMPTARLLRIVYVLLICSGLSLAARNAVFA